MKLRLTLDVEFNANGEEEVTLADNLRFMVSHAVGEGHLTGDSPAEVDSWDCHVDLMEPDGLSPEQLATIQEEASRVLYEDVHQNWDYLKDTLDVFLNDATHACRLEVIRSDDEIREHLGFDPWTGKEVDEND